MGKLNSNRAGGAVVESSSDERVMRGLEALLGAEVVAKLRGAVDKLEVTERSDAGGGVVATPGGSAGKTRSPEGCASGEYEVDGEVLSWADEMSEESSVSGLQPVSDEVRKQVTFGGFATFDSEEPVVGTGKGVMAQYIRSAGALGLRAELLKLGIKLPKRAAWHVALVSHTAATMPTFFRNGVSVLRTLAVLGDSVLVAAAASEALQRGQLLESVQRTRTTLLTDATMGRLFAKSRFAEHMSLGAGVDLATSKTGATALEAIVGVVALYRSPVEVTKLVKAFGLLSEF